MALKDRLEKIIKAIGMTKKDFAVECGVSRAQLFNYLKGQQVPTATFFVNLKKKYNWINLDWLITGEGEPDLRGDSHKVIPIDPAVKILNEAIEETGIHLNPAQRKAVIDILREEIAKNEGSTKGNIKNWIMAMTIGGNDD